MLSKYFFVSSKHSISVIQSCLYVLLGSISNTTTLMCIYFNVVSKGLNVHLFYGKFTEAVVFSGCSVKKVFLKI